jgi:hypothetical protein
MIQSENKKQILVSASGKPEKMHSSLGLRLLNTYKAE